MIKCGYWLSRIDPATPQHAHLLDKAHWKLEYTWLWCQKSNHEHLEHSQLSSYFWKPSWINTPRSLIFLFLLILPRRNSLKRESYRNVAHLGVAISWSRFLHDQAFFYTNMRSHWEMATVLFSSLLTQPKVLFLQNFTEIRDAEVWSLW